MTYTLTPYFHSKISQVLSDQPVRKYYRGDRDYNFPDPDVVRSGENFLVIESEQEQRFSVSMAHPHKTKLSVDDIEKLPHDLVLSMFRTITNHDLPFKKFFNVMEDGRDKSSPDIIYVSSDLTYVLEVGTTQGQQRSVNNYYEKKQNEYRDAIQVRCGANWIYMIIIVSRNCIMCNFPLTSDEIESIFIRYIYGMSVKQKVLDLGVKLAHDDEQAKIKNDIELNLFSEINKDDVNSEDFLFINESMLEDFNSTECADYLTPVLDEAKMDFYNRTDKNMELFKVDEYILSNFSDPSKKYKSNQKPVVAFPFAIILPYQDLMRSWLDSMEPISSNNGSYGRLWSEIRMNMGSMMREDEENESLCHLRNSESLDYNLNSSKKYREPDFLQRGRVIAKLSYEDEMFFADVGLRGKKHKNDPTVQASREHSKLGFSWDTDVSDIETFISRNDMFETVDYFINPIYEAMKPLFLSYFDKIESHSAQKFKDFLQTRIGMYLSFVTSTASELNVNIRKPTKGNEWILTYNRLFKFPIIMKNTGSNKHSYFSILVEKDRIMEKIDLPFTPMVDLGNYMCSKMLSTRAHDLSMLVGIMTKFYSTYLTFTDVCNERPEFSPTFRFNKECLTALLIAMENKEQTSSPIQNVRYMYMDMITTVPIVSNPFKVLTKFNTILRTRLILFLMKKIVVAFKIMINNKKSSDLLLAQQFEEDENSDEEDADEPLREVKIPSSQDVVRGMISYISLEPILTYEEALNLSYMGVFHEKDKSEEKQGYLMIFEKVIKEEIKMRPEFCDKNKMGYRPHLQNWSKISPGSLNSHEFSVPHVKMIGQAIKAKLRSSGVSPSGLREVVLNKLSKVCYEELATFKASAEYKAFTTGDLPYFGYKNQKRRKCLSAILDLMEEIGATSRCPFSSFQQLFKLFKKYGGLIANLFKKNQLTGVREIFVLYIHARVVVNFLETVSRAICDLMPNEYLTKGTEKLSAINTHYSKVSSEMRFKVDGKQATSETVSDSADATTWCQRFVMPVFGVMFNEIFGDNWTEMNHTLQSILNEVTFKRLELPKDLLDMFYEHQDVYSQTSSGINELKHQFLQQDHDGKCDINSGFSMFLKNRSNFMQGILHYTSSLVHSGHLLLFSRWISKMAEMRFGNKVKLMTTTLCSSDDATRVTSAIFRKGDELLHKRVIVFLIFTSSVLKCSYPLFTAQLSEEKSTRGVMTKVAEFNSVWFFRNTVLTPKIKWAIAAMQYKVSSGPVERQLQDHNLINDLIGNGCSTVVANDIQFACLINHLDCCGMMTLSKNVFYSMLQEMSTIKHPIAWFYFLSNPKTSTSLGYQYTKYWNLKRFSYTRIAEVLSRKSMIGESSDIGGRSYSVKMRVGDSHRYNSFIREDIKVTKEVVEAIIKENPEVMFTPSTTIDDEKLKILAKAHAPGAEKSFSFDSGSKQHSMASYIASKPCITVACKDEKFKCSLSFLTNYLIEKMVTMTDADFSFTYAQFPQMDLYERLEMRLGELTKIPFSGKHRKIKTKIRLPKAKLENLSPLKDVLSTLWFGQQMRGSRSMFNLSLESYRTEFPWIRNSFEESFLEFEHMFGTITILEFVSFLLNSEEREPTIEFLHSGRRKNGALNTLVECLSKNYSRVEILARVDRRSKIREEQGLVNESSEIAANIQMKLDEIETLLARAKTVVSTQERKLLCSWALDKQNLITLEEITEDILSRIERKSQPLLMISCIQKISSEPTDRQLDIIKSLYKRMNQGMLVWYKQEQRKVGSKYIGDALIDIVLPTANFTLRIKEDDVITEIYASQKGKVNFYSHELATFINKSLKVQTRPNKGEDDYIKTASFEVMGASGRYRENSKKGTPVLPMTKEVIGSGEIEFTVDLNRAGDLILRAKTGGISGESLKFSGKTKNDKPTNVKFCEKDVKDYNQDWFNNKSIGVKSLKNLLLDAEEMEEMREWLQVAINSRLMGMGETVSNKTALEFKINTEHNDMEMEQFLIDPFMNDEFAEEEFINMGTNINYDELVAIMEQSTQDTESFFTATEYMEVENAGDFAFDKRQRTMVTSKSSYFFSCITFDLLIRKFQSSYKMKLSEMYVSGYPERVKGDAKRLVLLLGIGPEPVEEIDEFAEESYEF